MEKDILAKGIDYNGDEYVLCWLPKKKEFVSWFIGVRSSDDESAYYHRRYSKDLVTAIQDFKKRICISEEGSLMDLTLPINIITDWNTDQLELYFKLKR